MKNPDAVSVVCPRCRMVIKPDDLRAADSEDVTLSNGNVRRQYTHGGECPLALQRRLNASRAL